MDLKEMGEAIRARRRQLDLSQEALAEAADISAVYVSQIERSVKQASFPVLRRVAKALGMDVDLVLRDGTDGGSGCERDMLQDCTDTEKQGFANRGCSVPEMTKCGPQIQHRELGKE